MSVAQVDKQLTRISALWHMVAWNAAFLWMGVGSWPAGLTNSWSQRPKQRVIKFAYPFACLLPAAYTMLEANKTLAGRSSIVSRFGFNEASEG
jgi:hypothetical protein